MIGVWQLLDRQSVITKPSTNQRDALEPGARDQRHRDHHLSRSLTPDHPERPGVNLNLFYLDHRYLDGFILVNAGYDEQRARKKINSSSLTTSCARVITGASFVASLTGLR